MGRLDGGALDLGNIGVEFYIQGDGQALHQLVGVSIRMRNVD
jgi:hypothetical protein